MMDLAVNCAAYERAAVFRGATQSLRAITSVLATPLEAEQSERCRSACGAALGDAALAASESVGRALSAESIIALGLEWLASIASAAAASSVDPAGKPEARGATKIE
jgi:hypothetical protein